MPETYQVPRKRITPASFWSSVNIYITKPHIINRRLWGSKIHFHLKCKLLDDSKKLPTSCSRLTNQISTKDQTEEYSQVVLTELGAEKCASQDPDSESPFEIILTRIIPKRFMLKQAYQLVCLEKKKCIVTFYDVTPSELAQEQNLCPNFTYTIKLVKGKITISPISEGLYFLNWHSY